MACDQHAHNRNQPITYNYSMHDCQRHTTCLGKCGSGQKSQASVNLTRRPVCCKYDTRAGGAWY